MSLWPSHNHPVNPSCHITLFDAIKNLSLGVHRVFYTAIATLRDPPRSDFIFLQSLLILSRGDGCTGSRVQVHWKFKMLHVIFSRVRLYFAWSNAVSFSQIWLEPCEQTTNCSMAAQERCSNSQKAANKKINRNEWKRWKNEKRSGGCDYCPVSMPQPSTPLDLVVYR